MRWPHQHEHCTGQNTAAAIATQATALGGLLLDLVELAAPARAQCRPEHSGRDRDQGNGTSHEQVEGDDTGQSTTTTKIPMGSLMELAATATRKHISGRSRDCGHLDAPTGLLLGLVTLAAPICTTPFPEKR